jgi:hypothetical protein
MHARSTIRFDLSDKEWHAPGPDDPQKVRADDRTLLTGLLSVAHAMPHRQRIESYFRRISRIGGASPKGRQKPPCGRISYSALYWGEFESVDPTVLRPQG